MRDHSAQVGLLALALLCACEDPEQDKFMSFGGISPDPTAIVEGSILYIGPRPICDWNEDGTPQRVKGRVILTMFEYTNPPPPEGSATTSTNLMVLEGSKLFQTTDCVPAGFTANYAERITRSAPFSWPRQTLYQDGARDYQIRGFYDYDEDMVPFFSISRLPTGGDIVGAAVNDITDASKGFMKITLPRFQDATYGAIISNVTVALGNPAWTERPAFRLGAERRLAADAPFSPTIDLSMPGSINPFATLRKFRGYTCADGTGDGVSCGLSLARLGEEDRAELDAAKVGLDLNSTTSYAFYTQPVDIKTISATEVDPPVADGVADPHPFLGSLGINWYQPMVLVQRLNPNATEAALETLARIPRVLMIGSVLMDDTTKLPIKSSFVNTPVPISLPPVAAVELIAGRNECRVPYFPPGTLAPVLAGRVAHCGELPTGYYAVNVLAGTAGGSVTPASGFPTTSESSVALSGGRYSGQSWSIPNELGDPTQVESTNVIPDQGVEGMFVVHDPSEGDPAACDASATLGQCEDDSVVINPNGVDSYSCLPRACCEAIQHLCGIKLCDKVDVPGLGRIASGPTQKIGTASNGAALPNCIPFEMPAACCATP